METTTTQTTEVTYTNGFAQALSIRYYYKKDLLVRYNTNEEEFLLWGEYKIVVAYSENGYPQNSEGFNPDDSSTWRNFYRITWEGGQLISCDGQRWETQDDSSEEGEEIAELATVQILPSC